MAYNEEICGDAHLVVSYIDSRSSLSALTVDENTVMSIKPSAVFQGFQDFSFFRHLEFNVCVDTMWYLELDTIKYDKKNIEMDRYVVIGLLNIWHCITLHDPA